jgi:hypothetical protein
LHAKVLAAPFDRDKAERARNKIRRDSSAYRRTRSRHKWRASRFAKKLNQGESDTPHVAHRHHKPKEIGTAKEEQRGNREAKKPKKEDQDHCRCAKPKDPQGGSRAPLPARRNSDPIADVSSDELSG